MPSKPKPACPVCRRLGCTEHQTKKQHGWGKGTTRDRRPSFGADRKRRKAAVDAWLAANGQPNLEGKMVAVCPDCFHYRTDFVADHVTPVALGGDEQGALRIHCRKCSNSQGSRIGNGNWPK